MPCGFEAEAEARLDRAGAVVSRRDDMGVDVDERVHATHASGRGGRDGYSARR